MGGFAAKWSGGQSGQWALGRRGRVRAAERGCKRQRNNHQRETRLFHTSHDLHDEKGDFSAILAVGRFDRRGNRLATHEWYKKRRI